MRPGPSPGPCSLLHMLLSKPRKGLVRRCCLVRVTGSTGITSRQRRKQTRSPETPSPLCLLQHTSSCIEAGGWQRTCRGQGLPDGRRHCPARASSVHSEWGRHAAHGAGWTCRPSFPRKRVSPRAEPMPRCSKPVGPSDPPSRTAGAPQGLSGFPVQLGLLSPPAR